MLYRRCMNRPHTQLRTAWKGLRHDAQQVRWRYSHAFSRLKRLRTTIPPTRRTSPWLAVPATIAVFAGLGFYAYHNSQPFKHFALAGVRCSRVGEAAILGAIDYKWTFSRTYDSDDHRLQAYSECHTRSAKRVLKALLANGGVFIKLGQHMSSLIMLPREWTSTMRPLQDQCEATPYEDVETLFLSDMGASISELFDDFDPNPIGVASLAQVHVGHHRASNKKVAVKLQHPHLAEFCEVDMEMVEVTLGWIKYWFPEFEFTWLGEEMRENLPKEMDFRHEARNAARAAKDFEHMRTSLYIPQVLLANKRVLIMEYIQGARVDDLHISRTPASTVIRLRWNFHGYSTRWYSLMAGFMRTHILAISCYDRPQSHLNHHTTLKSSCSTTASTLTSTHPFVSITYAELVGNIGPDLYPIFEAAMTGRAGLEGTFEDDPSGPSLERASGLMNVSRQTETEVELIRNTIMTREGMFTDILTVLRRVPRRVLMVLKLNDLTRNLDHSLMTTHSNVRVFLINAKYCVYAIWRDDQQRIINAMRDSGLLSFSLLSEYFICWW
ncbi:ABC1-domain-containing protein [Hymenopellis radicata]|nr:ABC1-domain-containing protein [Hymenopellis radicata]